MDGRIKVGLIGFGSGGRTFHAPFIANVADLCLWKIRETKLPNIQIARQKFPDAEIVADSKKIFDDPEIDLVVITTPNHLHYTIAKEALDSGKNVVVDKPFTVTSKEADELINLAEQKNKLISVFHNRRWDSDFKTIKKILDSRLLGNVVEFEAHFDRFRNYINPGTWKENDLPGAGILYDLGSHMIDQVLVLFGFPQTIHADLIIQREGGSVVDNFQITMGYEKLRVLLKAGMLVREAGPRYIISGDQGSFVKHGIDVQEEFLKAGKNPKDIVNWGVEPENLWGKINTTWNGLHFVGNIESETGNYSDYYINVARAIKGYDALSVSPMQARDVIRVIELAIESSRSKKVIVVKES